MLKSVSVKTRMKFGGVGRHLACLFGMALAVLCVGYSSKAVAANPSGQDRLIRIITEEKGGSIHFYVENLQWAEVTATLELELENLASSVPLPYVATFAPKKVTEAFTLRQQDPQKTWSWKYTYHCTWGNRVAQHDDRCVYLLPYEPGKAYRVSQGYHGKYSHFGPDEYSVDFKMPIGTPVYAARAGTVVAVKDDSDVGGPDKRYDWDANFILVKHADGTYGHYVHLQKDGNRVKVGQRIEAREWIGLSGNTGHTTGPHLHFSVFKARDGKQRETIPVRYRTQNSAAAYLVEGKSYRAPGAAEAVGRGLLGAVP